MKRSILITLMIGALALATKAGSWTTYQLFGSSVDQILQTPEKVYYTSLGSLYSYSPADNESYHWGIDNRLNGSSITAMYYNPHGRYIVVVYDDANMDAIYDDGRVVNMPQIKDATLYTAKTVNDIAFTPTRMYVATAFGLVIYDTAIHEVTESGIYNVELLGVCPVGQHLVVRDKNGLRHAPLAGHHSQYSVFTPLNRMLGKQMYPIGDAILTTDYYAKGEEYPCLVTYDWTTGDVVSTNALQQTKLDGPGQYLDNGTNIYIYDKANCVVLDRATGDYVTTIPLTGELASNAVIPSSALDKLWAGDATGVAQYSIASTGCTPLMGRMRPQAMTCVSAVRMTPSPKGGVIVSNDAESWVVPSDGHFAANRVDGNVIEDLTPAKVTPPSFSQTRLNWLVQNKIDYINSARNLVASPDDPDLYYLATSSDGIYLIKNNQYVGQFGSPANSPFTQVWGWRPWLDEVTIDNQGNLWTSELWGIKEYVGANPYYYVLPAAKRRLGPDQVKPTDWIKVADKLTGDGHNDVVHLNPSGTSIMFSSCGLYSKGLLAYDHNNTPENTADDRSFRIQTYIDQDGKNVSLEGSDMGVYSMAEDHDGRIWAGTGNGVFVIPNAEAAMANTPNFQRVKVPRNDGTPYADYLLDAIQVTSIAVDPSNRKWLATKGSGLYLVSPNGDEILENFLPSNSPLPSKDIWSVYADPQSNIVYVGTAQGLLAYHSDSAPAAQSYDDMVAYPNPVRPDYHGVVTIRGLMNDSLVKITDLAGNIVAQTQSEGGMATWDLLNLNGQEVPSGVYFILASNGAQASSPTGKVCKVTVIR